MKIAKKIFWILLFWFLIMLFNQGFSYGMELTTSNLKAHGFDNWDPKDMIGVWIKSTTQDDNGDWRHHWACVEQDVTGRPPNYNQQVLSVIDVFKDGTVEVTSKKGKNPKIVKDKKTRNAFSMLAAACIDWIDKKVNDESVIKDRFYGFDSLLAKVGVKYEHKVDSKTNRSIKKMKIKYSNKNARRKGTKETIIWWNFR